MKTWEYVYVVAGNPPLEKAIEFALVIDHYVIVVAGRWLDKVAVSMSKGIRRKGKQALLYLKRQKGKCQSSVKENLKAIHIVLQLVGHLGKVIKLQNKDMTLYDDGQFIGNGDAQFLPVTIILAKYVGLGTVMAKRYILRLTISFPLLSAQNLFYQLVMGGHYAGIATERV